MLLFSN